MSREVCNHNVPTDRSCQECMEESQARNVSPSPEASEPERGYCDGDTWHLKKPSPEARVDWDDVIRAKIGGFMDMIPKLLLENWKETLQAAFEKGRRSNG